MMSMISRQAASCIFGLAPFINNIINKHLEDLGIENVFDMDEFDLDEESMGSTEQTYFEKSVSKLIGLSEKLPEEDPKFEALLEIITRKQEESSKQTQNSNKIILFSTFKHTLAYLRKKLMATGLRIGQIDGSVKDEDRYALRERFALVDLPRSGRQKVKP
ncbi:hypothetical protein FACS1894140_4670 [Spirochaetia bacterium]|nr:hypothetical protein FACS1894140_4670 [Spirochaetia bacterium]